MRLLYASQSSFGGIKKEWKIEKWVIFLQLILVKKVGIVSHSKNQIISKFGEQITEFPMFKIIKHYVLGAQKKWFKSLSIGCDSSESHPTLRELNLCI